MNVVCHEAVRVKRAMRLQAEVAEDYEINEPIVVAPEAILAIIISLPDVHGDVRDDESRRPRHTGHNEPCGTDVDRKIGL